jgi:hypothetical protein
MLGSFSRLAAPVDALLGEFRRTLGEPADAAFTFRGGKRWIEQPVDLLDRKVLDRNAIVGHAAGVGGRWCNAETELDQLTNGVRADHGVGFRPGIDIGGQLLRQIDGADRVTARRRAADGVVWLLPGDIRHSQSAERRCRQCSTFSSSMI